MVNCSFNQLAMIKHEWDTNRLFSSKWAHCSLKDGLRHNERFVALVSLVWSIRGWPADKGACSDHFSKVTLQGFWEINFKHKKCYVLLPTCKVAKCRFNPQKNLCQWSAFILVDMEMPVRLECTVVPVKQKSKTLVRLNLKKIFYII